MESNLRPLTLGEILDRTANLYRANFLIFAGIFAVYCGVALLFNLTVIGLGAILSGWHYSASKIALISLVPRGFEGLALFLLFGAAVAAASRAVAWVNLNEPATIRGAYANVLPRLGRYLWLMTITALVVWVPIALLYASFFGVVGFYTKGHVPAGHAAGADSQSMLVVGVVAVLFLLLMIPAIAYTILMWLRYALALPACVIENIKARAAIRRGIELSKGARGRIFVLAILIGIIKLGLALFTQIFFIFSAVKHNGQIPPAMNAISQVIAFFTNTCLAPIYAIGITLLYYDQRVRKEGYDIEWMMQQAGMASAAPAFEPTAALPGSAIEQRVDPIAPSPKAYE